jgi:hypothetical protein
VEHPYLRRPSVQWSTWQYGTLILVFGKTMKIRKKYLWSGIQQETLTVVTEHSLLHENK